MVRFAQGARTAWHHHAVGQTLHVVAGMRGAVGLGIAIALANVTGVQHSFWVLLGTSSCSCESSTSRSAVR